MKNDTLIRIEGMEALMKKLGLVEAERFIMLLKREPFDYTQWRENQFNDKSIETIFAEAAALRAKTESKEKAAQSRKSKATKKPTRRQKVVKV
jgi:hypothetical protein